MSIMVKKTAVQQDQLPEEHTERLLLERLKNSTAEDDYFRWMLFLVGYYRSLKKTAAAVALLQQYLSRKTAEDEKKAHCHLALGQIAIDEQRLDSALNHFYTALGIEPRRKKVTYVLLNNLGYCLNRLGRFAEAEKHCRMAIEVNGKRASAYRNLGISLQGQGHVIDAAWAFVEAVKAEPSDDRARALLEKFVAEHPAAVVRCPWIAQGLQPQIQTDGDPILV
jgi:tetratricopeptide (TPR) repeat protein